MTEPAIVETHVSVVFFAGDRAYKLLKPIRTPFLDQSSAAARGRAVTREVELNRRLAPDVYLGTGEFHEGDAVSDHVIVMRRLPAERKLSTLVTTVDWQDHVRGVARAVAGFHAGLDPLDDDTARRLSSRDAVSGRWEANFEEMAPYVGTVFYDEDLSAATYLSRRYLQHREAVFDRRITDGMIRDGHGDLLADDIFCLDDGPRIIDCLAFDDDLRRTDVLDDIAFLAMDLERLAGPNVSQQLMSWYQEFTDEHHPGSLAHHYVAYRAQVRAKVSCIRASQGDPQAAEDARDHLQLCLRHLRRSRIQILAVGGGPGTGKSTLATSVGETLGWAVLDSDELRKDLTGHGHDEHQVAPPGEGIYRPEITGRVYDELLDRTHRLCELGSSVVLDASWSDEAQRHRLRALARDVGAELTEVECDVPAGVARERVARRLASAYDTSDATPEVVDHFAATRSDWPEAVAVDTTKPVPVCVEDVLGQVRAG
ncbi:MAG: AAA family ATPase [Acidimicrobiales bacterium]|nr:AAA family ATPase [Acidimicrobiales bacterium]